MIRDPVMPRGSSALSQRSALYEIDEERDDSVPWVASVRGEAGLGQAPAKDGMQHARIKNSAAWDAGIGGANLREGRTGADAATGPQRLLFRGDAVPTRAERLHCPSGS